MKLEDQVISLELAKKLKELGVKQESLFRWQEWRDLGYQGKGHPFVWCLEPGSGNVREELSAYTVAELGEMLPQGCESFKTQSPEKGWVCYWEHEKGRYNKCYGHVEADARAKMLIYLLENNLLPPSPEATNQEEKR
jgi:hypothetical protein